MASLLQSSLEPDSKCTDDCIMIIQRIVNNCREILKSETDTKKFHNCDISMKYFKQRIQKIITSIPLEFNHKLLSDIDISFAENMCDNLYDWYMTFIDQIPIEKLENHNKIIYKLLVNLHNGVVYEYARFIGIKPLKEDFIEN